MGAPVARYRARHLGVEDGEGAVGILVHPDLRLDVVRTIGPGGELQDPLGVAHGVVAPDHALGMQAEDVVDLAGPNEGDEG